MNNAEEKKEKIDNMNSNNLKAKLENPEDKGNLAQKIKEREEKEKVAKRKIYKFIIILVIIFAILDQISKILLKDQSISIIPNVLTIETEHKKAGVFGVNYGNTFSFILSNIIVLGIILKFISMQALQIDRKTTVAISMVFAGGFSNLVDRLIHGYVLEIAKLFGWHFNFSDILIILGWILLALFFAMYANDVRMGKHKEEFHKNIKKVEK